MRDLAHIGREGPHGVAVRNVRIRTGELAASLRSVNNPHVDRDRGNSTTDGSAAGAAVASYVAATNGVSKAAAGDVQGIRLWRSRCSAGLAHISVAGEIDLATAGKLRDAIAEALAERPERLILDLEGVTFADSQLVHLVEDARRLMGESPSSVLLVGARRGVRHVLAICDLDHLCIGAA